MQVDELTLKVIAQGLGANDEMIERVVEGYKNEIFEDIDDAYETISGYLEYMKDIGKPIIDEIDDEYDAIGGIGYD